MGGPVRTLGLSARAVWRESVTRLVDAWRPAGLVAALAAAAAVAVGCSTTPPDGSGTHRAASSSSPIAIAPDGATLWVVNPDADSVTPIDLRSGTAGTPVAVGAEPWAVALTPDGAVVVLNRLGGSLTRLDANGRRDVDVGPELGGMALSPTGAFAYVSVSSADEVVRVDLARMEVVARYAVGRLPGSLAVAPTHGGVADEAVVVVAHRLARAGTTGSDTAAGIADAGVDSREAWLTLITAGSQSEAVIVPYAFGAANVLTGLALAGDHVYVTHMLNRPGPPRDFEHTVSGALSTVSLETATERLERRVHLNEASFSTPVNGPSAVALTRDGATAYLTLAGSDAVMGVDLRDPTEPRLLGFWPTGANPRGIVLDRDEARAYVMNYLSRDVSVLDLKELSLRRELARIDVVAETLDPELARGKRLFNNASDPRISQLGWIACASCHPDGGSDGTTWSTPEGLRQTMPLWRLEGTAPFHASATRDEIQDFEAEIEGLMAGTGLAPGPVSPLLGEPNGGRSADLDALAAYVLRGIRVPRAAAGDPATLALGREVFAVAGCADCHGGPAWTRSSLPGPVGTLAPNGEVQVAAALRDVGTFDEDAEGLGADGFDVPTLLGLHATAPYLHDGSAITLADVLANTRHVPGWLDGAEREALVAFLDSIDEATPPFE